MQNINRFGVRQNPEPRFPNISPGTTRPRPNGPSSGAPRPRPGGNGDGFRPSVPDDIGQELDRFRQARGRFGRPGGIP